MYFERSKHGSERGLYKSTVEIQQDGTFLLYTTYGSGTYYCKINGTTYVINSYFDKTGKTLKEKIKNLLVSEIHKESEQMAPIGQKDVV